MPQYLVTIIHILRVISFLEYSDVNLRSLPVITLGFRWHLNLITDHTFPVFLENTLWLGLSS